jgi:hypothetical protein
MIRQCVASLTHTANLPMVRVYVSRFVYRCWRSLGDLDHHQYPLRPRPQHEEALELLQPIVDTLRHGLGRPACRLLLALETAVERGRRRTCMQ